MAQEARAEYDEFSRKCELESGERAAADEVMEEFERQESYDRKVLYRQKKVEAWLNGSEIELQDWQELDSRSKKQKGKVDRVAVPEVARNGTCELQPWDEDAVGIDCDF